MITYCTNVHPGESWEEVFASLCAHLPVVKAAVSPLQPFPVGLRLSSRASSDLDEGESARFRDWCRGHGLFVPTINGFPFGAFQGTVVKERAYAPDWRYPERADYTKRLAALLVGWLPDGMAGSVTTVPVCFTKERGDRALPAVRRNIVETLQFLDRLRQKTGKDIVLALEPEPGCYLETAEEVVRFFERLRLPPHLKDALGVCYDCCHHAVEYEDPVQSLSHLHNGGVRIAKVQVSSAPHLGFLDRSCLEGLAEPVYLHQVVVRESGGTLTRFHDIPDALASFPDRTVDGCRVHFHIPVFLDRFAGHATTRSFIEKLLLHLEPDLLLEVETYTWGVLPGEMRPDGIAQAIIREIRWTESAAYAANSRS